MSKSLKHKGRYLSTMEADDSRDYNCNAFENVYFMQRILDCLEKRATQEETEQLIKQLKTRIKQIPEEIKIKQGDEGYPGLILTA
jgi:hypothetical protein